MSTQANEVIPAQRSVQGTTRPAAPRPHLVVPEERMTFDGTPSNRTDAAAVFNQVGAPRVQELTRETMSWIFPARRRKSHLLYATIKRSIDIAGALVLSLVFSPLLLIIFVRMGLERGPILFRHRRIGQCGRTFYCVKFRTMIPNAEQALKELLQRDPAARAEWLSNHKLRDDPRVTRLGRFLRKTSLDELPQLLNVLRGEMSLVGPRPIVKDEMIRYGRYLPSYLAIKPGITGLWQVTGRNDTDYRRRVVMDTYYVRKQNLLLDLRILVKTVNVVLRGHGAY